jgi:rhamnose transport system permease protein
MSGSATSTTRPRASRPIWTRVQPERLRELSLVAIIALAGFLFSLLIDDYLTGNFVVRVTTSVAITAILAAAQTVVLLTRNVDLSVGSIVGVSAYLTGEVLGDHPGLSPVLAVGLAIGIGCALGAVNGFFVAVCGVPSIIVTLGTLAIFRTLLIRHAEAKTITASSLPDWVIEFPRRTLFSIGDFDVRLVFVVAVVLVLALQWVLASLKWGRWVYALGSNPQAAVQAGLPTRLVTLGAFVLCGGLSGLAGFLFLARFGNVTVSAGQGLELASVAAAVVGGVSIAGGAGTLLGALLGAVLIDMLDQSLLRVPELSEFWRDAVLGALILAAVSIDFAIGRRLRRMWAMQSRRRPSAGVPPAAPAGADDA